MANLPLSPLSRRGIHTGNLKGLAGRLAGELEPLRRLQTPAARWAVGVLALVLLLGLAAALFAVYLMYAPVELPKPIEASTAASTQILGADGGVIEEWHGPINRTFVPLDSISRPLQEAAIAAEDARFYQRGAVDLRAVVRAARANFTSGRLVQGGSTISQQYAKNLYVGNAPTLSRKVKEARIAYRLERDLGKARVLEGYLNTVYFGRGAYGVQAASKVYFGKPASAVTAPEAALLIGMIRSPDAYSPYEHPGRSEERRRWVLERMEALGFLTPAELGDAVKDQPALTPASSAHPKYGWYLDALRTYLLRRYGSEKVYAGGLKVQTTLDPQAQEAAEATIAGVLPDDDDPYAALASIDPATGYVRALVGGRDYSDEKYNIALQGRRQPGSAFKPLVLVAALEEGIAVTAGYRAPSIICPKAWRPGCVSNFGRAGYGYLTLERATINSVNTVYAQVVLQVGPKKVVEVAQRMGIPGPEWLPPRSGCKPSPGDTCRTLLEPVPSMALGSEEVTPLELASVYATLAAGGVYREPKLVSKVTDAGGRILEEGPSAPRQAISPKVAETVNGVLAKVITQGTGTRADPGRPAAGKTGTAQDFSNAWFSGYTPQSATAVWIGYRSGNQPLVDVQGVRQVTGGSLPAEIWREYMKGISDREPPVIELGEAIAEGAFSPDRDLAFAGVASDPDGLVTGIEISIDGAPFTPAGVECRRCPGAEVEWTYRSPVSLADGEHEIAIRSFDKPGHRSEPATRRFLVDTRPPAVRELKASGGAAHVTLRFDEPVACGSVSPASFAVRSGGRAARIASTECAGETSQAVAVVLAAPVRGGDQIAVGPGRSSRLAADRAGNRALELDEVAVASNAVPAVELAAGATGGPVTAAGVSVAGTATDPDGTLEGLAVSLDGGPFSSHGVRCRGCGRGSDGAWEYRPEVPLAHGEHRLAFRSQDNAGAVSSPQVRRLTVDAVAPRLVAVAASGGSARVQAAFSEPVTCTGLSAAAFDVTTGGRRAPAKWVACSGDAAEAVELELTGAVRGGDEVSVRLKGRSGPRDVAGNPASDQAASGTASNLRPVFDGVAAPAASVSPARLELSGGTTDPDGTVHAVEVSVDGGPFGGTGVECTGCERGSRVEWSYRGDRLGHGEHELRFRSVDNAGVRSRARKVELTLDAVAPVLRQLRATGGSQLVELEFSEPLQCTGGTGGLRVAVGGRRAGITSVSCEGPLARLSVSRAPQGGQRVDASLGATRRDASVVADSAGNAGTAASMSVEALNQPPVVETSPTARIAAAPGEAERRPAPVEGTATDPDGVVEAVELSLDGANFSSRGVRCRGCGRSGRISFSATVDAPVSLPGGMPLVRAVDSAGAHSGSDPAVAADVGAPELERIEVAGGRSSFSAVFSEPVDCSTLAGSDFRVSVEGRARPVLAITCKAGESRVALRVSGRIAAGDQVLASVTGVVHDPAGNPVAPGSRDRRTARGD